MDFTKLSNFSILTEIFIKLTKCPGIFVKNENLRKLSNSCLKIYLYMTVINNFDDFMPDRKYNEDHETITKINNF